MGHEQLACRLSHGTPLACITTSDTGRCVETVSLSWLARMVMGYREGTLLNIVVSIGGLNNNNNDFSLGGLIVSFIGTCILLAIVNLVRRVRGR